jgi:hypothetical protein
MLDIKFGGMICSTSTECVLIEHSLSIEPKPFSMGSGSMFF